ncbi:unnamed protein product [Albugo candida]|uniref:JmjC domain-containing protein n=1 Tax=Albugo candida TaxID=65357 RepID=A0A024GBD2_9STRA|nr:unnamed protein product [Albugo candida]CCI45411.1 unnamed protein product [Albugo candida]|eukprot:CCI43954.1 unnamed protein product [Albugo candida]
MTRSTFFRQYATIDSELDVLATSSPLDISQFSKLLQLIASGLEDDDTLHKQFYEIFDQFEHKKSISCASAMQKVLSFFDSNTQQKWHIFFQNCFVQVLRGHTLPDSLHKVDVKGLQTSQLVLECIPDLLYLPENHQEEAEYSKQSKPSVKRKALSLQKDRSTRTREKKGAGTHDNGILCSFQSQSQNVQIINVKDENVTNIVKVLRFAGTPFILEGCSPNWLGFHEDWIDEDTCHLNIEAFLRGMEDVKVPVLERNYEETSPIKRHLLLGEFVREHWLCDDPKYYMHQWQYPLDGKVVDSMCYKSTALSVLGDNLLSYWLDSVRGDNPLQYLFMGGSNTSSRMHQDRGGLDILITPILGAKHVEMLHRDAGRFDSVHEDVDFHHIDCRKSPLLAFIPTWSVDVNPGQILFLPEGTFHACKNITPCLSHHQFHLDTFNMLGFLDSFIKQDAPKIDHAEILWNAAHDVMAAVEEKFGENAPKRSFDPLTIRQLESLTGLRHAVCHISMREAVPTKDAWDWRKLLNDVETLLNIVESSNSGRAMELYTESISSSFSSKQYEAPSVLHFTDKDALEDHWKKLLVHVGDVISVRAFETRLHAQVLKVVEDTDFVQVHYVDWESIYDEHQPIECLLRRDASGRLRPFRGVPKIYDKVLIRWGPQREVFQAIIHKVTKSHACYVQFIKFHSQWNQWILPQFIYKKMHKQMKNKLMKKNGKQE